MNDQFIKLLEQDAAQAHSAAQAWKELEKHGARFEDANGKTLATAAQMVEKYTARENEFRALIASVRES